MELKRSLTQKINEVLQNYARFGNLSKEKLDRAYFCKRLNRIMDSYETEMTFISNYIYTALKDIDLQKNLNKKEKK